MLRHAIKSFYIAATLGLSLAPSLAAADLVVYEDTCQWSTVELDENGDPTDLDLACLLGEIDVATAGGGEIFVVGTHGSPGSAQCLPDPGTIGGTPELVCSICYAGSEGPGGTSIAECVAVDQGYACEDVIACTGSVSPVGNTGTCAEIRCNGVWVDACGDVITPWVDGVCFTYGTEQPTSNPVPGAATVGCFAGDQPHDVYNRCEDVYEDWVASDGQTCTEIWQDPSIGSGDPRFQECHALVQTCFDDTMAVCQANAIGPFTDEDDLATPGEPPMEEPPMEEPPMEEEYEYVGPPMP